MSATASQQRTSAATERVREFAAMHPPATGSALQHLDFIKTRPLYLPPRVLEHPTFEQYLECEGGVIDAVGQRHKLRPRRPKPAIKVNNQKPAVSPCMPSTSNPGRRWTDKGRTRVPSRSAATTSIPTKTAPTKSKAASITKKAPTPTTPATPRQPFQGKKAGRAKPPKGKPRNDAPARVPATHPQRSKAPPQAAKGKQDASRPNASTTQPRTPGTKTCGKKQVANRDSAVPAPPATKPSSTRRRPARGARPQRTKPAGPVVTVRHAVKPPPKCRQPARGAGPQRTAPTGITKSAGQKATKKGSDVPRQTRTRRQRESRKAAKGVSSFAASRSTTSKTDTTKAATAANTQATKSQVKRAVPFRPRGKRTTDVAKVEPAKAPKKTKGGKQTSKTRKAPSEKATKATKGVVQARGGDKGTEAKAKQPRTGRSKAARR